jgi:hypothetical protein
VVASDGHTAIEVQMQPRDVAAVLASAQRAGITIIDSWASSNRCDVIPHGRGMPMRIGAVSLVPPLAAPPSFSEEGPEHGADVLRVQAGARC